MRLQKTRSFKPHRVVSVPLGIHVTRWRGLAYGMAVLRPFGQSILRLDSTFLVLSVIMHRFVPEYF